MDQSIACNILSDFSDIEALADDWRTLQARAGTCPFSCYDWFCGWWQTIGNQKNRSLHIVTASKNGKLVGILPLSVRKFFGVRVLKYAGNEIFDYCSALAEDTAVAEALWETARKSALYDFALFRDVRPNSPDFQVLSRIARKFEHNKAPYINLTWPSSQAWLKSREKKQRRDFNYKSQRLSQFGPITLDVVRHGPVPLDTINTMIRHKIDWFSRHRKIGIFLNPLVTPVFRLLAEMAAKQGKLFLATLKCGDIPVSHVFGFIDKGILYCYFTSYNPAWAAYSPGTLVFAHTIGWAIDNGLKEYDFLRGVEGFKLRYASDVRDLPLFSYARTPLGFLGAMAFRVYFCFRENAKNYIKRLPVWVQKPLLEFRKKPNFAVEATLKASP